MGIGGGIAVFILDPAQWRIFAFSLEYLQFAVGCCRSSQVGDEWRLLPCRNRHTDRVCTQQSFDRKCGGNEGAGIGHGNADHILLYGLQGMVTGDAKMIGVLYTDPARANFFRFFDSDLHGEGGYDQTQSAVSVDYSGGRSFMNNADIRFCVGSPGFPEANIPDKSCDAVGVDSPKVGAE